MSAKSTSLTVHSDLRNLPSIRSFIETAGAAGGLPEEAILALRLAVDEACANIIIHGYKTAHGDIEITVKRCNNSMRVTLCDQAPPFNPLEDAQNPDFDVPLDERPLGGMGIFLIKQNTDASEYRKGPNGGNALILTKHLVGTMPG